MRNNEPSPRFATYRSEPPASVVWLVKRGFAISGIAAVRSTGWRNHGEAKLLLRASVKWRVSSLRCKSTIRSRCASATNSTRFGLHLKAMPTTPGSAAPTAIVPAGASPSMPSCTRACTTEPSPLTTAKTAKPLPSGEAPSSAVPSAPLWRAPVVNWALGARFHHDANRPLRTDFATLSRGVRAPAKTPPAASLGALASGLPSGSTTLSLPSPRSPNGAFAIHGRPKALLIDR